MTFEPTLEQLILFQQNRLEPPVKKAIEDHLRAGCDRCDEQMQWIARVLESIHGDPSEIPPQAMDVIGQRIFTDHRRRMQEKDASVTHAVLTFDSAWVPVPAGARAPVSGQRRLVFVAEPFEIDLEISKIRKGRYDILGQLLPPDKLPEGGTATLHRRTHASVPVDRRGMFAFEGVARGKIDLTFQLDDRSIRLSQVPIG